MIKEQAIKKLIKFSFDIRKKGDKIENILGCDIYEMFDFDTINDVILDLIGIPEDNTVEYANKYGHGEDGWINQKGVYCRDWTMDILLDYTDVDKAYRDLLAGI